MDFLKEALGDLFAPFSQRIAAFNDAHPERKIKLCDLSLGNYVSRGKFSDLEAEAKRLKEALASFENADVMEQKAHFEAEIQSLKDALSAAKLDGAIRLALEKAGARNEKAVRALLDVDKLTFQDGEAVGLSEQIDAIREENSFLFSKSAVSTGLSVGDPKPPQDSFIASARVAAGLNET